MTLEELEARVRILEDTEAIKKLQRAYNYYLQHWQSEEIISLFSKSPDISLEVADSGLLKGMEGVKKFFTYQDTFCANTANPPPEFLHIVFPLAGIVDVDPGGKTAKGRWYGFGMISIPPPKGKIQANLGCGIWENEYVKEDGKWKFKKINYNVVFNTPYEDGWVKTPYTQRPKGENEPPPGPDSVFAPYPSGYMFPYHYKNPVTGK